MACAHSCLRQSKQPSTRSYFTEAMLHQQILGIGGRNSIDSVYAPPYSDSLLAIPLGKRVKGSLGYPGSGFVFSFLGHAGFILDYSDCGSEGEPKVVYVDAEYKANLRIAVIAPDFAHLMSLLSDERVP